MRVGNILKARKNICYFLDESTDKRGLGPRNESILCMFLVSDGASDIFTVISERLTG